METISVLFAAPRSTYKSLDVDVWDAKRDARRWPGGNPLIAHPPCAQWSSFRHLATPNEYEKEHAIYAINCVRANKGVLEHPLRSKLWGTLLPLPGERDQFGFTFIIDQSWFNYRARKRTCLYIVGIEPSELPPFPIDLREPTHTIGKCAKTKNKKPALWDNAAAHTTTELATWLIQICRATTR